MNIHINIKEVTSVLCRMESLLALNGQRKGKEIFTQVDDVLKELCSMMRNEMKCDNVGCNVTRSENNNKLYKCKQCQVIRYCSRKCQKIDWNKNNHTVLCERFTKMLNN